MKGFAKLEAAFKLGTSSVNLAPMLAILFISARMRALQIDPKHGNPQRWAQRCFFSCTVGVVLMTFIAVVVPLIDKNAVVKPGKTEDTKIISYANPTMNL